MSPIAVVRFMCRASYAEELAAGPVASQRAAAPVYPEQALAAERLRRGNQRHR